MASRCKMFARTGFCLHGSRCPEDHTQMGVLGVLGRIAHAASLGLFRTRYDAMKTNMERIEADVVRQNIKPKTLDLVIVMDCSGSMRPWMEAAKSSVYSIIDKVGAHHGDATLRIGFVAYRDFFNEDERLQVHALTDDIASVRGFIGELEAIHNQNTPEDIPGGLDAALQLDFAAAARCVILITDAPCHGREFHDLTGRNDDNEESLVRAAGGPDIREQMRQLARRGIDFSFIEIVPKNTAKMAAILQYEYEKAVASDGRPRELVKVSLAQSAELGDMIAAAGGSSLEKSRMRTVLASAEKVLALSSLEHYGPTGEQTLPPIHEDTGEDGEYVEIVPIQELDWADLDDVEAIPAVRHSYCFRPGHEINWASLDLRHTTQDTTIKLLPACFARGAMRSAHAMYDLKMGKRFVAKIYSGRATVGYARTSWSVENDVKSQVVAKRLAVEFSVLPQGRDGVDFIFTSWYEIEDPQDYGLSKAMASFTAEPYIAGEYKKYNNNNGWIYDGGEARLRETAQAFSHFTWQRTLGQLMVVDLQGVGNIFTDPQIHSLDKGTFGRGNLSDRGMMLFFATHTCNDVCKELGLLPFTGVDAKHIVEETTELCGSFDATTFDDKAMVCSCALCGEIVEIARSAFVDVYTKGREVFCDECLAQVEIREPRACVVCGEMMQIATFWYEMKGMAPPTSCKTCKAVVAVMTHGV